MPQFILHNAVITSQAIQRMLDGQPHLVIPAVALKQGVLNGVFYPNGEIETFAQAWNGVPIPVAHPERDGINVSANAPEFDETVNIGKFFNAHFDDGKLKGEIWLSIEKANRLGYGDLINHFSNGKMMEISTGLFCEKEEQYGKHNGVAFNQIAKHIRPDHIALLPDEVGACSIADGCGAMRTNSGECEDCKNEKEQANEFNVVKNTLNALIEKIYKKRNSNEKSDIIKSNTLTINEKKKMEKEKIVSELIANKASKFVEADKEVLMNLELEMLKKLIPDPEVNKDATGEGADPTKPDTHKVADPVADPQADPKADPKDKTPDPTKPVANANTLTDHDFELFNRLKAVEEARVAAVRKAVVDNYKHLTETIVANMNVETVEALAQGIVTPANYGGQIGAANTADANAQKPRKPISVLLNNGLSEKESGTKEKKEA